jgi:hypothetical protein
MPCSPASVYPLSGIKFLVTGAGRDVDPNQSAAPSAEFEYDEETKTMRVPLSALQETRNERRTRLVTFSCNKCGEIQTGASSPYLCKVTVHILHLFFIK